jgi:hypothetical protein
MENQPNMSQPPMGMPQTLPNATAALVLGIISIPTCICYGIVGMACGIIAIVLGSKAIKLYKENPGVYNPSSYNNANAGKICGIIGVILSALYLVFIIVYIVILGAAFSAVPWQNLH